MAELNQPVTGVPLEAAIESVESHPSSTIPTNGVTPVNSSELPATTPTQSRPKPPKKKGKKEGKRAGRQRSEDEQRQPNTTASKEAESAPADTLLFQRLAYDMTDGLMNASDASAQSKSLDLFKRLSSNALSSTTTTNVTSTTTTTNTTTTTTELNVIMEKETSFMRRGECARRTASNNPFDFVNDSNSEISEDLMHIEKSVLGHTSSQASKLSTCLRSSQIDAKIARQIKLTSASRRSLHTFTLSDFAAIAALETLAERYGRVSHMGILDPSYTFFINQARTAALYYKVKNKIAVVGGDPLCELDSFPQLLGEFAAFRKAHKYGIAFLGASDAFAEYAKEQKWVTMQFGIERVLNPLTNPILLESGGRTGKRMTTSNRHLLEPKKGGLGVEVYSPSVAKRPELQAQLVGIYDAWRDHRNGSGVPQAYITVYDPFALPNLMTYIYTKDREGRPNGFAALRKLGANNGFHIDPCIAAPSAPKGVTDLLVFSAMALLNKAGISYLSFGFEPLDDLGEITGMPKSIAKLTKIVHKQVFRGLRVGGKKEYHAKFRPDESQESGLHLVFPDGRPGLRHMTAIVHHANISVRQLVVTKMKKVSVTQNISVTKTVEHGEISVTVQ